MALHNRGIEPVRDPHRRRFLRKALAGAAAGVGAQAGIGLVLPRAVRAQTNRSPEAALQERWSGNRRFAAGQLASVSEDLKVLKEQTLEKQEPFAAVLACADSRLPGGAAVRPDHRPTCSWRAWPGTW